MRKRDVPNEWVKCFTRRHAKDEDYIPGPGEYTGPKWARKEQTVAEVCTRCGTIHYSTYDSLGNIVSTKYVHPSGYLEARRLFLGQWNAGIESLRREYVKRLRAEAAARLDPRNRLKVVQ